MPGAPKKATATIAVPAKKKHRLHATAISFSILSALVIGFGGGYIVGAQVAVPATENTDAALANAQQERDQHAPPTFAAVPTGNNGAELIMTTASGSTSVYTSTHDVMVVAVPTPYAGKIVVKELTEKDIWKNLPAILDVNTKKITQPTYSQPLPTNTEMVKFSPDAKTIAAVYRIPQPTTSTTTEPATPPTTPTTQPAAAEPVEPTQNTGEVVFFDAETGQATVIGKLNDGEWASRFAGSEVNGAVRDATIRWSSAHCIDIAIFREPTTEEAVKLGVGEKIASGNRTFCRTNTTPSAAPQP